MISLTHAGHTCVDGVLEGASGGTRGDVEMAEKYEINWTYDYETSRVNGLEARHPVTREAIAFVHGEELKKLLLDLLMSGVEPGVFED